jgi:hypothetical protein
MDTKFRRTETRRQNALDRLGTNKPCCVVCGETDPHCLELHHLFGRKNDPDTLVIVCRNCHRKLSDAQKDHVKLVQPIEADPQSAIPLIVQALADLFHLLHSYFQNLANKLMSSVPGEGGDHARS